ncbi:hypothetical protein [Clostridium perfringens]|uniref:hypothetical protein n=1 Tax=Clostridium perfringens TaxID=1502 RepID=UPI0039EC3B73
MDEQFWNFLTSFLIPIIGIILTILFRPKKNNDSLLKEAPEIIFSEGNKEKINSKISTFDIKRLIELEVKFGGSERSEDGKGQIVLSCDVVELSLDDLQGDKLIFIGIKNMSNSTIEIYRMIGIEDKTINLNNENKIIINGNERVGIIFRNECLIEQISIEEVVWKCKFKVNELKEGFNRVHNIERITRNFTYNKNT